MSSLFENYTSLKKNSVLQWHNPVSKHEHEQSSRSAAAYSDFIQRIKGEWFSCLPKGTMYRRLLSVCLSACSLVFSIVLHKIIKALLFDNKKLTN